jgi:ABC-2 type transport system ATP-binding protein
MHQPIGGWKSSGSVDSVSGRNHQTGFMTTGNGLAIEVRRLTKRYGEITAVDGIDLVVFTGEIFALLGPNGAGKSTTVEMLEGFRNPSSGAIKVLGQDPTKANLAWRDQIGVVLQSGSLEEECTVQELLTLTATYYRNPRPVSEAISLVGLQEKTKARIGSLSGGQQRRVDVALGIIGRPELLFLDEPTTGFDPEARRQFWDLIRLLRDEGTTIVLTTHYLDEAEVLADRVGVIVRGRMVEIAEPKVLGGRATALSVVRWQSVEGPQSVATPSPTKTVLELAEQFSGEIPELRVVRPSLEDVYLSMIGDSQ